MKKVLNAIDKIESTGLTSPFEICDIVGVDVRITTIKSVPAFYQRDLMSNRATIYIDSRKSKYVRTLLCWHELGHILTEEKSANLFNHKLNPVSEFTANVIAMHFMDGLGISEADIDMETPIENINKYISLKVAANGTSNFEMIPLNDTFWDIID